MEKRIRQRFQRKIQQRGLRKKAQRRRRITKNQIHHKKINKRKHYGVGVDIKEYEELIQETIDYSELDDYLSSLKEKTLTESFVDDAVNRIRNLFDTGVAEKITDIFQDSHDKGTRRLFDKDGEQIDIEDVEPRGLEKLTKKQSDYLENLEQDMGNEVENELQKAMKKGESIPEARDRLINQLDNMSKNRAETIARSEIIKASSKGTENAMDEAGVDKVIWVSTDDSRTCGHPDNPNKAPDWGGCWELHRKPFERREAPTPVEDTHPNSYDGATDILTEEGWKNIKDIEVGDKCLSLNPETFDLEHVPVIKTYKHKASEMIHFKNRSFDLMVTPDHNMFFQRKPHKAYEFIKARELKNFRSGKIPRSSKWKGTEKDKYTLGDKEVTPYQYAEFMAWYLSEGSSFKNKVSIAQSKEVNKENYLKIEKLLEDTGFRFYSCRDHFEIKEPLLSKQLMEYGKCNEKYVPRDIKEAPREVIRTFLDTYLLGDGHERKGRWEEKGNFGTERVYTTSSPQMASDLGELMLKAGNRPSYYIQKNKGKPVKHKNGVYKGNFDTWRITECRTKNASLYRLNKEKVKYRDYAYCVDLAKHHTLYARRNGKCTWSGNCRCTLVADV